MAPGEPTVGYWVVGVAVASAEVMTHPVVVAAAASTTDTSASRPVTMFEAHAPLTTSGPKIPEDTRRIGRFRPDWDLYWSCNRSCLWRPGRR